MIVSASYRTDIPAFYADWFRARFRAGFARAVNPYGGQVSTIPLRDGVDGFVFWTRNIGPFLPALAEVRDAGIPFVVQYTVTGYPRQLETSVIEAARSVELIRSLESEYGPKVAVWRYDPVVVSSLTDARFHRENFARLADALAGATDEVVVSFANIYRKTRRNLDAAARTEGFAWSDSSLEEKQALAADLVALAQERALTFSVCTQAETTVAGAIPAACVDATRLETVARGWGLARPIAAKVKGNRPGCLCHESRDIGDYDTCPHGCTYCYAVGSRTLAKKRFRAHDPQGEFLIPPRAGCG